MLLADHSQSPPRALSWIGVDDTDPDRVWFSHDATETGEWAKVDWRDFSTRQRKKKGTLYTLTGEPRTNIIGTGSKGPLLFFIESCPWDLYDALRSLADTRDHYTLHIEHPVGTKDLEVEVMSVQTPSDEQLEEDDPVGDVTIAFQSFGAAS